jgi:hypothetical protein
MWIARFVTRFDRLTPPTRSRVRPRSTASHLKRGTKTRDAGEFYQRRHPYDRDSLAALVNFLEQFSDPNQSSTLQRLDELEPDNPQVQHMLKELHEHSHG